MKVPQLAHPYEPLEREIDVVFDGGRAWGEVKSISRVLDTNDFGFDRIIRQLVAQSEYRDQLNQRLPRDRQIREIHIFLMNGVTRRARRVFERIGVIVHAPVRG
jgi:hypothetical protein